MSEWVSTSLLNPQYSLSEVKDFNCGRKEGKDGKSAKGEERQSERERGRRVECCSFEDLEVQREEGRSFCVLGNKERKRVR